MEEILERGKYTLAKDDGTYYWVRDDGEEMPVRRQEEASDWEEDEDTLQDDIEERLDDVAFDPDYTLDEEN